MMAPTGAAESVVARFAAHAARRPDAVAVLCGGSALGYRDLARRSDRLAWRLGRHSGLESLVAVCLPAAEELAVALLGVLKAGAAYVLLDPAQPAGRLRSTVEETGAGCVVAPPGLGPEWPVPQVQVPDQATLPISGSVPIVAADLALCVAPAPTPADPGRLVVTEHGSATGVLQWGEREQGEGRSLWLLPAEGGWPGAEMFAAWWSGGCAVLAGGPEGIDPAALADLVRREGNRTVSMPAWLLADPAARERAAIDAIPHIVTVGGEPAPGTFAGVLGDRNVISSWGPPEAHAATVVRGTGADTGQWRRIGSPAAGGRAYVLDTGLRPVPINVPGELFLAGTPLARGYAGRPDLTAADFLPDPFTRSAGRRMFRTPYRARWRSDGTLELLDTGRAGPASATSRGGLESRVPRAARPMLAAQPAGEPRVASFAQERSWLLDQMDPGNAVYVVACQWRLTGPLDTGILERAFRTVVGRHGILRTRVRGTGDGLVPLVDPVDGVPFEHADLSGETDPEQAAAIRAEAGRTKPFDADTDPTTRALLMRLGPDGHVLQILVHHAAFDTGSGPRLTAELSAAYAAYLEGHEPRLPRLPVQYSDYAAWQREEFVGRRATEMADHWRAVLADAPPVLEMPADRPRPPTPTHRAIEVRVALPDTLVPALRELAEAHRATMATVMLAAYQLLLSRYAETRDVVVGTPADARRLPELAPLIGPLVNAVPSRVRIEEGESFACLLDAVRQVTHDALAHRHFPFARLVEELAPGHDPGRHPVFQVWFQLVRGEKDDGPPALPGVRAEDFLDPPSVLSCDLALCLTDQGESVSGTLAGAADLFEESSLRRFAGNYLSTLAEITREPTAPTRRLELIGGAERELVLHRWNDAGSAPRPPCTVVARFEENARTTPDAPALTCGDTTLTYGELDRRAGEVAKGLSVGGVGPGSLVGVCLARELDLPVALLAVAKSGAGYIGLDPGHPPARLAGMVSESDATTVITTGSDTSANWPVAAVTMAGLARAGGAAGDVGLPEATAGDTLYVLFTSGSTGRPKGVVMSHGPTARLMDWTGRRYRPRPVALAYFPVTSDVFSYELWSTWWTGGHVVLATETDRFDTLALARRIAGHQVTTVLLPGAVLGTLAATHSDRLGSVTELITTGDRLRVTEPIRRLAELGARLDNQWGSTEVNVVTAGRLEPSARPWPAAPGIGSPVSGGRIHVLDEHLRPAPIGVPGDLYVGGTQLAYGYIGQPDLTAEAFLPDPYSVSAGRRMYATGDRGRWLGDGTLEFLGRADQQVKVHGYRVEPAEIEAVIAEHPDVVRAAVLARPTDAGVRLSAYLQPVPGHTAPDTSALREWMGHRLPGHMMPAAFTWLDPLPTTATGKIDRQALPEPDFEASDRLPPRDGTDRAVIDIWQDVLGRSGIGITDNFFELGGYSLLIPQVVYRLNQEFGIKLPPQVLFRAQTVMELADEINAMRPIAGKGSEDARAVS